MFYVSQRKTWGLLFSFILFQPFLFSVPFLPTETVVFPPSCRSRQPSRAPLPSGSCSSAPLCHKPGKARLTCFGRARGWAQGLHFTISNQTLVFPAVPWLSPGLLCPGMRRMLRGLSLLLLLQVLHPPTASITRTFKSRF